MSLQLFSFLVAAVIIITGALGVVLARNPVHAALFLIQTLFGVAVEFLVVEAHFLAAIQVIVYAGAIVILFLFVIMLLGVDKSENIRVEPIIGQRPAAVVVGAAILGLLLAVASSVSGPTGAPSTRGSLGDDNLNVNTLAESIFTDYVFAFEVTGLLLTVAVVGAVVMARRISGPLQPIPQALRIGTLPDDAEAASEPEPDAVDAAVDTEGGDS